jgi:ubiquinone/menaquinone biosynthesis C-methylase UbiE
VSAAPASSPLAAYRDERAVWRRYDDDEQRLTAPISERLLDLAALRPGQRVLDIATGRGEPAVRAAARVAPGGLVLGTDRSADMLELARERAAHEGVTTLQLLVADAQTLPGVPVASFDVALSRWGLMYVDRPREALAAAHRSLKPEGTLVLAVWTRPAQVAWWSVPRDILARHASLPASEAVAYGTFRYAEPAALHDDLAATGFALRHEEERETAVMEAATPEALRDWCLAFGGERLLAPHPPSVRAAWEADLAVEFARRREPDGFVRLGGVTRLVVARAVPLA